MDRLTVEVNTSCSSCHKLKEHLLDIMRENERLRETLEIMNAAIKMPGWGEDKYLKTIAVRECLRRSDEILKSNKDSND